MLNGQFYLASRHTAKTHCNAILHYQTFTKFVIMQILLSSLLVLTTDAAFVSARFTSHSRNIFADVTCTV